MVGYMTAGTYCRQTRLTGNDLPIFSGGVNGFASRGGTVAVFGWVRAEVGGEGAGEEGVELVTFQDRLEFGEGEDSVALAGGTKAMEGEVVGRVGVEALRDEAGMVVDVPAGRGVDLVGGDGAAAYCAFRVFGRRSLLTGGG